MDPLTDRPQKANILIADDTIANLRLLSTMLETNGYGVYEASNGETALEIARIAFPDIILLDVLMPGMDGYSVCRKIKNDPVLSNIPVIFVSALDEQTDKVQGFAVGGVDYITKPFQAKEVLARVETHLTLRNLQRRLELQNQQLQQEIAERKRAETALQHANEELEQRVQARTVELMTANEILNSELQERKRAEDALRKSQADKEELLAQVRKQEQQVREIIYTVPEGVVLLDDTGCIIQANPVAQADLEMLLGTKEGNTLQSLGEKTLAELFAPQPHDLWHDVVIKGRVFEVIARPTTMDAEKQRWVMVMRDVTREREIQGHSQQQERLAAVGQLAAGIAHDFNNILAVILLYTEMAIGTPDLPPKLRERLLTILQQSRRASDLIQQILDFSRRTMLERRQMDLLPFLKEQVKLLERTMPENIRIELSFKPGVYVVNADLTRIQQVIMNLAVNARDAMPDGGRLLIHLDRLDAKSAIECIACGKISPGDWITIRFTDNGIGIPPDVLPHVFDPFFTTKEHGQGTGLGLSQVFGIIEKHDGHVNVSSSKEAGTTFNLYLPSLPVKRYTESETDTQSFIRGQRQTIMVVEDEPATRTALLEGLSLLNYKVVCTSNGLEALTYIREHPKTVDLVLSDVVMPEMGGVALFQALLQAAPEIPVILMTGHPLHNELDNLLESGLTAWLMKPPRLKHLAKLIGETLSHESSRRSNR